MAEKVLQLYLDNQFIKTSDTEDVARLNKAVTEVAKRLKAKKAKIIPYTLVAIDPLIAETEPVVIEVEKIIIQKWGTFKNSVAQTKDKPTVYIRAVILEALLRLAKDDGSFAGIVWHTSRDSFGYFNLGNEGAVLKELLERVGNEFEKSSREYWGGTASFNPKNLGVSAVKLNPIKPKLLNQDNLENHLKAAATHSGWGGGGENPGAPTQGTHTWGTYFGERAAKGISEIVDEVFSGQAAELNRNSLAVQQTLNSFFNDIQPLFDQINQGIQTSVNSANKRGELLWWKQTLCSTLPTRSYRTLSKIEACFWMTNDLAKLVSGVYPASVDYLLREALRDVFGNEIDESVPLSDWISEIKKLEEEQRDVLKTNNLESSIEGKKPLGVALSNYVGEASEDVFTEARVDKKMTISLADLAVWLFHDLQAAKLAAIK